MEQCNVEMELYLYPFSCDCDNFLTSNDIQKNIFYEKEDASHRVIFLFSSAWLFSLRGIADCMIFW